MTFVNTSTGTIVSYAWDYESDGTVDSTIQTAPSHNYAAGTWTITLTVADSLGQSSTTSKTVTFTAPIPTCTVPNFKNKQTSAAIQTTWTAAGFATSVIFNPSRPPEFKITKQSLAAGSLQPCATAVITVFDK